MKIRALCSLLVLLASGTFASGCRDAGPATAAQTTDDINASNLLANERYWPYRVKLTADWQPPGRDEPLPAGFAGVLIRVEPSGLPRIDFGRFGKYEVTVEQTDLVERANQIRQGREAKEEPNFVHAIKSRMLVSDSDSLVPLQPPEVAGHRAFLCVFADPGAAGFEAIAHALVPLRDRDGVMTILFAQGTHPDPALREQLRALDWKVPFLYDYLSEAYTRTLLVDGTPFPYVMLQTAEGRVLLQGAWSADLAEKLDAELRRAFATAPDGTPPS